MAFEMKLVKEFKDFLKFINKAESNGVKLNPKLKETVLKAAGKYCIRAQDAPASHREQEQ